MNSRELKRKLTDQLSQLYSPNEASKLSSILLFYTFGISQAKIVAGVEVDESALEAHLQRLMKFEPIEYIFEQAVFLGEPLYVNPSVLIPRPETEELVQLLYHLAKPKSILDICTGSGCIAKGLAGGFPQAQIQAWDISPKALEVAQKNLPNWVTIKEIDFLKPELWPHESFELVVSNPPYVTIQDREKMAENVLRYEPHLALFAPGEDDLIFYRKLALFAQSHLAPNGTMGMEINESKAAEVLEIFQQSGFSPKLYQDINGKDRFVVLKKN
jgi:release factor glutamine methyltransferase